MRKRLPSPDVSVRHVAVVFKTHLDIGFTDLARNVVHQYVEDFIPAALTLAEKTRNSPDRFVWTTGSWLIFHFLENAARSEKRRMEAAIRNGDFHWHALPFTTHTELMDESLFRLGLQFRDRLDERFGRKTSAAKMTDVPGHTRAMVPLLAKAGVRLLHIGVNPASTVPAVPPVFTWRNGGQEFVVIYDKIYGSTTRLPGGTAVSVNLTNDNMGPPSDRAIARIYSDLRGRFPKAAIMPGNLTDVADGLWKHRASLPVVTSEIGDSWIHGLGTDPRKVAEFRELSRLRRRFIAEGRLAEGGDSDLKFGENLLLTAEHTWGMDVKTHLAAFRIYSPAALAKSLKSPAFKKIAASWSEQRDYIARAVKSLSPVLRKRAETGLNLLTPKRFSTAGWKEVSLGDPVRLGNWDIHMSPDDGSIRFLALNGSSLVPKNSRYFLAGPAYQTFSREDYRRFYRQYNTRDVAWARKDFTKVGLPASALSAWHVPQVKKLLIDPGARFLVALLTFDRIAQEAGAPREMVMRYESQKTGLNLELQWFGKRANRMPEALWLGFVPRPSSSSSWMVEKLGQRIDTADVVRDGARGLHASTGPVVSGDFSITSPDAVLVAAGEPKLLNFDNGLPRKGGGVHFNLWNNMWNTNFPQWYSDDARFRFELRWKGLA